MMSMMWALCSAALACAQDATLSLEDGPYISHALIEEGGGAVIVQELLNQGLSRAEHRLVRLGASDGARVVLSRERGPDMKEAGLAWGGRPHELLTWSRRELRVIDVRDGAVLRTWRTSHAREGTGRCAVRGPGPGGQHAGPRAGHRMTAKHG